jgi:hypothetical protein
VGVGVGVDVMTRLPLHFMQGQDEKEGQGIDETFLPSDPRQIALLKRKKRLRSSYVQSSVCVQISP